MRALLLAAFLVTAPLSAQAPDSIPVPYPVAEGGAFWHVLVDSLATSQHTTLHGGLRTGGLRKTECEGRGEPCSVRVCSDIEGDGFCYRVDLRWVQWSLPADTVPDEPEPDTVPEEPEPEILGDSITFEPAELEVDSAETETFTLLVWYDDRPWGCADISGDIGLLARAMEHGTWTWDYPVPEFLSAPVACDIEVGSTDTTVVTVDWEPAFFDVIPTRPAQYRLQTASGTGTLPTATFEHTPDPGSLLVAMLTHREDWQTPEILGDQAWERVMLHTEDAAEVTNSFRKGVAVWVRRAGTDEPRSVSATWSDMALDETRSTHLTVWELDGYGDFIDASVVSSEDSAVGELAMAAPGEGALVGLVAARSLMNEAVWDGLEDGELLTKTPDDMTVLSATGDGQSATVVFDQAFPVIGVLLRFLTR